MNSIILICGSRNFHDYDFLENKCNLLLSKIKKKSDIKIISGGAKGVDSLAKIYADNNSFEFAEYPANWKEYGKKAGYLRNKEMVEKCTHCIAFWNGESKGTKHSINLTKSMNKPLRIMKI